MILRMACMTLCRRPLGIRMSGMLSGYPFVVFIMDES